MVSSSSLLSSLHTHLFSIPSLFRSWHPLFSFYACTPLVYHFSSLCYLLSVLSFFYVLLWSAFSSGSLISSFLLLMSHMSHYFSFLLSSLHTVASLLYNFFLRYRLLVCFLFILSHPISIITLQYQANVHIR